LSAALKSRIERGLETALLDATSRRVFRRDFIKPRLKTRPDGLCVLARSI